MEAKGGGRKGNEGEERRERMEGEKSLVLKLYVKLCFIYTYIYINLHT